MFRPTRSLLAAGLFALSGTASAEKFTSLYNHPDLNWRTIETEHFAVHYPVSRKGRDKGNEHFLDAEWTAKKTAAVAEEMWEPMCAEFNYYLEERVHIVILDQPDDLEGFTIPTWDWIEISANPGGDFYRLRGRMEWISDVMVHEFAHVVSLKANGWMAEGTQGILVGGLYQDGIHDADIGAEVIVGDSDSVFWTEGGAEYWSDNTGYNWWTTSRDMNIRMTVLEDRLLRYEEWHDRAGKIWWGDGERYYQQGYSFALYLRQRFGEKTYAKFAVESGKVGWRTRWEQVIEDVTGVDAKTLYEDWVAYVRTRYTAQAEAVRAKGEVEGRELLTLTAPEWEFATPDDRDAWAGKKEWEREKAREKTGRWLVYPRVSTDGRLFGHNTGRNIQIDAIDDSYLPAFTGYTSEDNGLAQRRELESTTVPSYFGHAWDFVPGTDAVVVTGSEHIHPGGVEAITGFRWERDGYDWKQLWWFDLRTDEKEVDGKTVPHRLRRKLFNNKEIIPRDRARPIPNTLRGIDPAVSPDGKRVAYFEYEDGTLNLVTINIDGTDKKYLTDYHDGTWLQQVDWSPDGQELVFAMFRNYQQDLYVIRADGSGLRPLMWDSWEDMDAHWAPDGRIYFSSDPTGIFNIYSYDPSTKEIRQITNVISGAQTPVLTPDGNLVYQRYSAYGWKIYGLARGDFMNAPATGLFRTEIPVEQVQTSLAWKEDLSAYVSEPYRVRPSTLMSPTAVPMFRVENDTQTNPGVQGGFQVFAQDYVENHGLFLYTLLGEDLFFLAQYFNNTWYPSIYLTGYHYEVKFNPGYFLDLDDDLATKDDQEIYEIRNQQYANIAALAVDYPLNDRYRIQPFARYLDYGFKTTSDTRFLPYLREAELGLYATFTNTGYAPQRSPNTFTGRTVELAYNHAWTDVVYAPYGGVAVDDGMELDAYGYNKTELRWTENIRTPTFWGIPVFDEANKRNHVVQVDALVGYIDRNVDFNDEFLAGGQHPYFWGSGTLRPNTQFAGYPGFSLSGETMAILNLAYRFPISQYLAKKVGPLFVYGIYAQVGGTAGNLWSFRVPTDTDLVEESQYDDYVAKNPADVRREIPFVDYAYKNGNYLLYDASAELRVQSTLFHGFPWDSFVRVAWGFNEIRGYGDVDGDGVTDTTQNAVGDSLSTETEKPGPRVYVGLGTGW